MQTKKYPNPSTGSLLSNVGGLLFAGIILYIFSSNVTEIWSYHRETKNQKSNGNIVSIELARPSLIEKRMLYIESNPDVPSNTPDKANFFSSREQQTADLKDKQEIQDFDKPSTDGTSDNLKVIKNRVDRSVEKSSPLKGGKVITYQKNSQPESLGNNDPPPSLPVSTPDIKQKKELKSYYSVKEKAETTPKIIKLGENTLQSSKEKGLKSQASKQAEQQMAPRPRVSPQLLNGPILRSKSKASRIGEIAIDCKLHPYGVYVQQMLQAIESQWHQLVKGSILYIQKDKIPPEIVYRFVLNSNGKVIEITSLRSQNDSLAADLCRQAISSRAPFGAWSDEMIKDLGESDLITIKFSYH